MVGGSVSAVVKDASAIWYNPAGLGASERDQVDVSATVYTLRLYKVPKFIESVTGESDDASVAEFVVAPTQIAYVRKLKQGLSLGLGYFVPRASNYVLREQLDSGPRAARSTWQFAAAIAEMQHTGAAAVGFEVSSRLRIGAGLVGGYAASTQSVSLFGTAAQSEASAAASSSSVIGTSSRLTLEPRVGMQLQLSDALTLGIAVRGPEVQIYASSSATFNNIDADQTDRANAVLAASAVAEPSTEGVVLRKAGRAGASLAYSYSSGWVVAEIDVQPALQRANRNALVNGRIGLYQSLLPTLALGVGLFTDRLAEAKRWDVMSGGGDFYGATLGLEFSNEHLLAPSERATSIVFNSVFALRYAYCDGVFGRTLVDASKLPDMPFTSTKGDLFVHEFGLYVGTGMRL